MKQDLLFEADDHPQRELGWIYNPSAPATEEELRELFRDIAEFLDQPEGRTAK